MESHLPIKAWAEEDRPREKLLSKGKHTLSDAELIAILIGSGNAQETAVDVARRILSENANDLNLLGRMNVMELQRFRGIGEAKALAIVAALELGKRRKDMKEQKQEKITSSKEAVDVMQPLLGELMHEEFWIIFLNRANLILGKKQISMGGMSGTVADPKMIFKAALDMKAVSIILCHNHPSGNNQPSAADTRMTKNIAEAGKVLEINVLDHIIVTQHGFYSFADEGLL
jgi:DNA repair protein RadC